MEKSHEEEIINKEKDWDIMKEANAVDEFIEKVTPEKILWFFQLNTNMDKQMEYEQADGLGFLYSLLANVYLIEICINADTHSGVAIR